MAVPSEGFSAVQHGPPLLHLVAMRPRAGSHSSRALRRMPREGGTGSQPHRRHHRQPKREKRRKRGACIDPHGYDAGKLIKGKNRHILLDTLGLLLHAIVHSAGIQDRDGGILLLATLFGQFPFLETLFAKAEHHAFFGRKARSLRTGDGDPRFRFSWLCAPLPTERRTSDEAKRRAFGHVIGSINSAASFPAQVFRGSWGAFLFFESDRLFASGFAVVQYEAKALSRGRRTRAGRTTKP
jgi:hypothetical protein